MEFFRKFADRIVHRFPAFLVIYFDSGIFLERCTQAVDTLDEIGYPFRTRSWMVSSLLVIGVSGDHARQLLLEASAYFCYYGTEGITGVGILRVEFGYNFCK